MTILFISLVAVALTFLLYRKKAMLAIIRVAAIIILTGMITDFQIKIKTRDPRPLIALIDISASTRPFFNRVRTTLDRLESQPEIIYFAESLYQDLPDSSEGNATDIIKALRSAAVRDPSSIILVSDGNHNYGSASIDDIGKIAVPVNCYGVGQDSVRDQAISQVVHPRYAYPGDSLSIEVITRTQGFDPDEKGRLTAFIFDRTLSRDISLTGSRAQHSTFFNVPVKSAGEHKLTFNLLLKPGEMNNSNNEYQTAITVLNERIKVLYYAEHLSFTPHFLLSAIKNDKHIALAAVIKLSKDRYWDPLNNEFRSILPEPQKFDVCIFDNINAVQWPWPDLNSILEQKTGIIFIGLIESPNPAIMKILPIRISDAVMTNIKPIQFNSNFSKWGPGDELPPFEAINRVSGLQEKAFVIASTDKIPVIAHMAIGTSIVMQINGSNPGVLNFLEAGIRQREFFNDFLPDMIRFVARSGRNQRLVMSTQRSSYRTGEIVTFSLQSYDRNYRAAGGGDFHLEQDGKLMPFYETSPGNYQASIIAGQNGGSVFRARGRINDETLISDPIELLMTSDHGESIEPINHQLLEAIARQTGGKYNPIDSLREIGADNISRGRVHRLMFDHPIYYFLIFMLLAIEWFVRRKRGII